MSRFLIVGQPRSRLAWLSAVASLTPGAICYHEPIVSHRSWEPVFRLWKNPVHDFVGLSDAHMGFKLHIILETFRPRTLMVMRPIEEVEESLYRLAGLPATNYCDLLQAQLDKYKDHPLVKVVQYSDLSDLAVVRDCMLYLMPGTVPDSMKIEEMSHMNVQEDLDRTTRKVQANQEFWQKELGTQLRAK